MFGFARRAIDRFTISCFCFFFLFARDGDGMSGCGGGSSHTRTYRHMVMFHDVNYLVWVLRASRAEEGRVEALGYVCVWMWMYVFAMPVGQLSARA